MTNPTSLAQHLRLARKYAEISQEELATRIGSCQADISRYETGETVPSPKTVRKLCRELGVSFETVMSLCV